MLATDTAPLSLDVSGARTHKASVASTLLLPAARIAREPLHVWAQRLARTLRECDKSRMSAREYARAIASAANMVSLISISRGAADVSRRLCELEAEWLIRFGDVHGDSAIRSLAIQPWVNIGRLDALEGNWAGALSRYAGLSSTSPCSALVVLGHSIEIDDAVTADAPVTLRQMANNIYVLDSLQALLRNHQAGEMLEFVERLSPTCGREFQPFLREAAIVAHAELGRADEAVHLARSAAATVSGWPMLVFRLRLAETLAVGDNMSSSRAVLTPIASVVPRVSLEAVRDLSNLRILQRAATVAAVLCWPEAASALARVVFDGASTAGDEPLCIESARLLSTVDSTDVARWTETRQRLEEETMYRQYRSGDVVAASDAVLEAEALVAEICSS